VGERKDRVLLLRSVNVGREQEAASTSTGIARNLEMLVLMLLFIFSYSPHTNVNNYTMSNHGITPFFFFFFLLLLRHCNRPQRRPLRRRERAKEIRHKRHLERPFNRRIHCISRLRHAPAKMHKQHNFRNNLPTRQKKKRETHVTVCVSSTFFVLGSDLVYVNANGGVPSK
jgi:hypothetical protein